MEYKITPYDYITQIKKKMTVSDNSFSSELDSLLHEIINQEVIAINEGRKFYRARIYKKEDWKLKYNNYELVKGKFKGYNEKESFVNLSKNKSAGRANSADDSYLYMSSDINTCITEVCNKREVPVSVAEIIVLKDMKVVNLSKGGYSYTIEYPTSPAKGDWICGFKMEIAQEMNRPYFEDESYRLTQHISEYIRKNKIDGIKYKSASHCGNPKENDTSDEIGNNYVIFNYNKCKAISSDLYRVTNIDITKKIYGSK